MNTQATSQQCGADHLPMTLPECPCGHGAMHQRDTKRQTPEQLFCGVWYDCHECSSSVLFTSVQLQAQLAEQRRAYKPNGLKCAMHAECCADVTHIDPKGFTLCAEHAASAKRGGRRNRKLSAAEHKALAAGNAISYEPRPRSEYSSDAGAKS